MELGERLASPSASRGKKGPGRGVSAFYRKLMRGLALTARTLPPIPPNGLLGWKEMPPAASPVTQNGLVTALQVLQGLHRYRVR